MTLSARELDELGQQVSEVLSEVEPVFAAGMGARASVVKGPGDFATAVDLELEKRIGEALNSRTGFAVAGEELGGADIHSGEPTWLIDPIDGTANYMHSLPLTGMNCALVVGGVPVVGATWLPALDQRYLAVSDGSGGTVGLNGEKLPPREPARLADVIVGIGNPQTDSDRFPRTFRRALLHELLDRAFRVRLLGSCALELAWVAAGTFGAAVQFSVYPWDLASGVCLNQAAGASITTLDGRPFTLHERSVICAVPGATQELAELVATLGDPAGYA